MSLSRLSPALLLVITLLAFALRTAGLADPPLSGDEAFTVLLAERGWADMLEAMRATEPNPPLHFVLLKLWMVVAGRGEFSVRFLSVMAGLLAVPLTYVLGRRLLGGWAGLVAALLAAVNPYLVWYSHFARVYSLYLTLTSASLILALNFGYFGWASVRQTGQHRFRILRLGVCPTDRPAQVSDLGLPIADLQRRLTAHSCSRRWGLYVVVTVSALYTHYFAFLLLIAQNLIIFAASFWRRTNTHPATRNTQHVRTWLAAQAAVAILVAPWLILAGPMLLRHEKAWLSYTSPAAGLWRVLRVYSLGVDVRGALVLPLALLYAVVLAVGVVAVWRKSRPALVVLGTYLSAPSAIVLVGSLLRPIFLERYLIGGVPAFLVLIAAGLTSFRISDFGFRISDLRTTHHGLMLVALITLLASAILAPPFGADFSDWRGVARALGARVSANDVVVQNYPDPALAYYYQGAAERTVLPVEVPIPREATDRTLRALLRRHDRLWLLPHQDPTWDAGGFVQSWLDRRAELVVEEWVAGHHLLAYRAPSGDGPEIQHRLGWRLGDVVRLAGYRLNTQQVVPGGSFELTLFWEPLRTIGVPYTVFVHLWDGETIWGQQDGEPRTGAWPTTEWFPGDLIVDPREVPIDPGAPAGEYQLIAGLYRLNTGERLLAYDADGRLRGDYVPIVEMRVEP